MMKPSKTGTILDNYKTWAAFTRDTSLTTSDLIQILNGPYIPSSAVYICRHVNFHRDVLVAMRLHHEWFVQAIGLFHRSLPNEELQTNAIANLQAHTDKRIARTAWNALINTLHPAENPGCIDTYSILPMIDSKHAATVKSWFVNEAFHYIAETLENLNII